MASGHSEIDSVRRAHGRVRALCVAGLAVAVAAGLAVVAAGPGTRLGLWHFRTGFRLLGWGAWGGAGGVALSLAGLGLAAKHRQGKALLVAIAAIVVGATAVTVPLSWKLAAGRVPPIHDITTDMNRPPEFVAILPLRADAPNPASYGGADVAMQQAQAYPDIRTLIVDAPQEQAFSRAREAVRTLGWQMVAESPAEGRIEATDTTFWFGFTDDIVIRITPAGYRSLVDIRSVSRVGKSDVGTNAGRIRKFLIRMGRV